MPAWEKSDLLLAKRLDKGKKENAKKVQNEPIPQCKLSLVGPRSEHAEIKAVIGGRVTARSQ